MKVKTPLYESKSDGAVVIHSLMIRDVQASDFAAIARLFYETVHHVNAGDYSAEQLEAWAPRVYEPSYWQERFQNLRVYVAEDQGQVVGFAELERTGRIDCFYVHHQRQRCGIGARLMAQIEADAASQQVPRLFADVSLTARPFFEHQGFSVEREQERLYRGVRFAQFLMTKQLTVSEPSTLPDSDLIEQLTEAITENESGAALQWASEADYPLALCTWDYPDTAPLTADQLLALTGHVPDAPIQTVDFLTFFEPATRHQDWYGEAEDAIAHQYRHLVQLLQTELSDLQVFKVGQQELDIYIIGHTRDQHLIGVTTKAVET
jgi:putative acetyltransferase